MRNIVLLLIRPVHDHSCLCAYIQSYDVLAFRWCGNIGAHEIVIYYVIIVCVERGNSVVECRTRNQVSMGSNPPLLPFRRLGIETPKLTQLFK